MDTLQMTDNLSLVKEKIIKTDEVLRLLGNKSKDLSKVEKKYSKLLEKYAEKNQEIELWKEQCKTIEDRLSVCTTTHLPLQNDLTVLKTRYESLEQNHNVYVNAAEIKYQNSCQEVQQLSNNVAKLTKKIEHLELKGTQQPRNVQKLKTELSLANDNLKKSVLKYEELIADNNKAIAELKEQYASLEQQQIADLMRLAQIQLECDELKQTIQKSSTEKDSKPAALQKQIENFQHELKSSTDKLTILKITHENDLKEITEKFTLENKLLTDKLSQLKPKKLVTNSTTQTELDDVYNCAEILTEMTTIPLLLSPLTLPNAPNETTVDELITDDVTPERTYVSIASGPTTILPIFKESSTQTIDNSRPPISNQHTQTDVFQINENTDPKPKKERTKSKTNKVIKNYKNAINKMLKNVKNNLNTKNILDNVLSTSSPLVIVSPRILKSYLHKIGVPKPCRQTIKPCCCLSNNSLYNCRDEIKSYSCNNHDKNFCSFHIQRELDMKCSCSNHGREIDSLHDNPQKIYMSHDYHNLNTSCDNRTKINVPSRNTHVNGFCSIHENQNKINCSSYNNHSNINRLNYDNSYNNHKCSLCGDLACSYNNHNKDFPPCTNYNDVKCLCNCEQKLIDSKQENYDKINSSTYCNHRKESFSSYDVDLDSSRDYYNKINSSSSNNQCCAFSRRCENRNTINTSEASINNHVALVDKCYCNLHASRLRESKINKLEQNCEYRLNIPKYDYKKKYRRIVYSSDEEGSQKSYIEQRNTKATDNTETTETNLALATDNSTEMNVNVIIAKYLDSLPLDQNTRKAVSDTDSGIDTLSIKTVKSPISIDINNIENYISESTTLNIENQNGTLIQNAEQFEDNGIHVGFNKMQTSNKTTSKNGQLNSMKSVNQVSGVITRSQNTKLKKTKKFGNKKLQNFILKTIKLRPNLKMSKTVQNNSSKKLDAESEIKLNKITNSISESTNTDESINKNYLELDSKSKCNLQENRTENSKLELSVNDEFINKNIETKAHTEIQKVSSTISEISTDAVLLKSQQVERRNSKSESSTIEHSKEKNSLTINNSLNENVLKTKATITIKKSHEPQLTKLQQNCINTQVDFLNLSATKKRKNTSGNDSGYKKKKIDLFGSDVESDTNSTADESDTYRFLETPKTRVAHKPQLKTKVASAKNAVLENTDEFIQNKTITKLVNNRKLAIDKLLPKAKITQEIVEPKIKDVFKRPLNIIQNCVVQPCPKLPDIITYAVEKPKNIPLNKVKVEELDLKIGRKLVSDVATLNWNNDLMETVVNCLSKQDAGYVAKLIVNQVAIDYSQEFDKTFTPPAPLMTVAQQKLLVLMTQLEKNGLLTIQQSFLNLAEKRLLSESKVESVHPLTRLYVAVCKLKYDIEQVRMLCCNAAYYMGDLVLPLMFIILTMWGDVLPMAQHTDDIHLATALVQIIQSKTCKKPGYNFMNLNNLLRDYYGYKRETIDEALTTLINAYTENCSKLICISILILCKNQPSKWTYKQITTRFIPIITNNMQTEAKSNLVSVTFTLVSRLVDTFDANTDKECIKGVHDWLCKFMQENGTILCFFLPKSYLIFPH